MNLDLTRQGILAKQRRKFPGAGEVGPTSGPRAESPRRRQERTVPLCGSR